MDQLTRQHVRQRARFCCEYCQLSELDSPVVKLQVEHIVPRKHGGTDDFDNLALACIDCNLHKGSNLTGIDPETGQIVKLFDPRTQLWAEHFRWEGYVLAGITPSGRTTVRVLDINAEDRVSLRTPFPA
jgi:hypothetical protein